MSSVGVGSPKGMKIEDSHSQDIGNTTQLLYPKQQG